MVLDRVVAIPIEVRSVTRGVLMAGLLRSEDSAEDFSRLESYALLAATALDREAAREERTASNENLRKVIEDSRECLILLDGEGKDSRSQPGRCHASVCALGPDGWNAA